MKKGEGGLEEDSYVDCGQIRTVDNEQRLITKFGSLNKPKMIEVDKALKNFSGCTITILDLNGKGLHLFR